MEQASVLLLLTHFYNTINPECGCGQAKYVWAVELQTKVREDFTITEMAPSD